MSEELKAALARIACLEGEITKRDARIMGLESQYQRDVWGLNNEGDPIGGDPAGGYANDNARLRAELAAIKAKEPVAYISGCYRDVIDGKSDRTPLSAELAFVNMGWIGQIPLYAAPVPEAKAQGVVMPTVDQAMRVVLREMGSSKHIRGTSNWCADVGRAVLDEVARLNAAPVQQVVPDGFERYRLANKFCEQRLVTDDHVRAIVVDAFASGYGFGIAAAPAAPAADAGLVEALETIINPIEAMRRELQVGEQLNGMVAMQLASDPEYLRGVAKAAIAAHRAKGVV